MTPEEADIRRRLRDDFTHYSGKCLKIRTKGGAVESFGLNRVQSHIHHLLEKQRQETGKVRVIILKGRQQGCSTYVEGRFYWRVSHQKGVRAFILTHEQAATDNLFEMVCRYHDHCPELVRPHTAAANAKELYFDLMDSGYKVGTAGTKGVGRSSTVQLFHGSEVAFWPNAETHAAGVLQAVPDEAGTEIILESTANGIGNYFHQQWQQAEAKESDYLSIFIPWFWQSEYRKPCPDGIDLTAEELEYQAAYKLDAEQMAWRRAKIADLTDTLFRQEYPATAVEAFQSSATGFISSDIVLAARKTKVVDPFGPLVLGVDPAAGRSESGDRTAIIRRRGRKAYKLETMTKLGPLGTMQIVGRVVDIIAEEHPEKVFIDVCGLGVGVVDRLRELGYGDIIMPVNAGEKASSPERYNMRKAEMWGKMYDWLKEAPVEIPDLDSLHADLTGPQAWYDSNSRLTIEKKESMATRGVRSPDEAEALALTFAFPVRAKADKKIESLAQEDFRKVHGTMTRAQNLE